MSNPYWDDDAAATLVGAYVLVGITDQSHDGETLGLRQLHGIVRSVSQQNGIVIDLHGSHAGEEYTLPPGPLLFQPARPGTYRLRSTNEEVQDPDFIANWIVTKPPPESA